ncbi:MAG: hypothetical protein AVDCRST_MAG61-1316 [uncultured Friedmanniella sp.]|uniref:Phosphotyrosine protein phosphatase I domain-containing protein n=1 Tax=uncultured Friedmanniella sp. TaxID=335381 RepID=A0A6J4KFP0_9ACTN|nr:hypothetical protein [uncultured Friedmanniella sp.]CAA9304660.1 MAG: hypothetical protein AVDCRST_MAG61-1316 [uncultured Friedmanniella sp.]
MTTASTPTPLFLPRVLFVGSDASSAQIAASLLHRLAGDRVEVYTAGTEMADPGGRSDEMLVAMGLDPADQNRLSAGTLHMADRVVILGTDLDVARLPGPRYEEWDLTQVDLIDRIENLCDELTSVPASRQPVRDRLRRWRGSASRRP